MQSITAFCWVLVEETRILSAWHHVHSPTAAGIARMFCTFACSACCSTNTLFSSASLHSPLPTTCRFAGSLLCTAGCLHLAAHLLELFLRWRLWKREVVVLQMATPSLEGFNAPELSRCFNMSKARTIRKASPAFPAEITSGLVKLCDTTCSISRNMAGTWEAARTVPTLSAQTLTGSPHCWASAKAKLTKPCSQAWLFPTAWVWLCSLLACLVMWTSLKGFVQHP